MIASRGAFRPLPARGSSSQRAGGGRHHQRHRRRRGWPMSGGWPMRGKKRGGVSRSRRRNPNGPAAVGRRVTSAGVREPGFRSNDRPARRDQHPSPCPGNGNRVAVDREHGARQSMPRLGRSSAARSTDRATATRGRIPATLVCHRRRPADREPAVTGRNRAPANLDTPRAEPPWSARDRPSGSPGQT